MRKEPSFLPLTDFKQTSSPSELTGGGAKSLREQSHTTTLHFNAEAPLAVATKEFNVGLNRATAAWLFSNF